MKTPVHAKSAASQERIRRAARSHFERFGCRRSGIAAIARDAGVAAGTVYLHFQDKEALFRDTVTQRQAEWLAEMRRTLEEPGGALERLVRLGQASIPFNRRHTLLMAVLDRDTDMIAPALLDELHDQVLDQQVALVAEVIREGIADGTFRRLDPERAAFVLIVAARSVFHQRRYGFEDILPLFIELTTVGLLATDSEPRSVKRRKSTARRR